MIAASPSGDPDRPFAGLHVAIVVAHPDDEVLGAGGQFATMRRLSLVHLTDGAPSDRAARWHGCPDRRTYADIRERELADALRASGVEADRIRFGLPDQQAAFHLAAAATRLADLLGQRRPDLVLTHPYEGGHPDHDAAAAIAAAALRLAGGGIPLWEFTSYHADAGTMVTGRFLPCPGIPVISVHLSDAAQTGKRRMRACFRTQHEILSAFPTDVERFRRAPEYDFSQPPHAGRLLYESRRRAWTGTHWRRRSRAAERLLATEPRGRVLRAWPAQALLARAREIVWRSWLAS